MGVRLVVVVQSEADGTADASPAPDSPEQLRIDTHGSSSSADKAGDPAARFQAAEAAAGAGPAPQGDAAVFERRGMRVLQVRAAARRSGDGPAAAAEAGPTDFAAQAAAAAAAAAEAAGGVAALLCSAADVGRAATLAASWVAARHGLFPSAEAAAAWVGLAAGPAAAAAMDVAALRAEWARRWGPPCPPPSPSSSAAAAGGAASPAQRRRWRDGSASPGSLARRRGPGRTLPGGAADC